MEGPESDLRTLTAWQHVDVEDVGKRLKQVLKDRNIKAEHFAKTLGVTSGVVSKWVNGKQVPSGTMMLAIQRELVLPSDWLEREASDTSGFERYDYPQLTRHQNVAMRRFSWNGVTPAQLRIVVEGLEKSKSFDGFDPHPEYWTDQIRDLLNERASKLPRTQDGADLTQESPEVRAVRKRPRKL